MKKIVAVSHRRTYRSTALILALLLVGIMPTAMGTHTAQAAGPVPWQYKGFTIAAYSQDELGSSNTAASLQQLSHTGANSVTFVMTWYQDSIYSSSIYRTQNTASDASLTTAISEAKALGLRVIIKPHVDSIDGNWRAHIHPCSITNVEPCPTANDLSGAWFSSYDAMMLHYADLAQQQGVTVLSVGAELIDMSTNAAYTNQWRSLISEIRSHFGGKLTYSANWGSGDFATEYTRIPFWDALDYIGISAYFPLADNGATPTVDGMTSRWINTWQPQISAVQQQWNKPVLFIEGGYRSGTGTAQAPFDNWDSWPFNAQEQADCYQATFQAWANVSWFAGAAFWNWETDPNVSGTNTGYSVQNKPAQSVVTTWYGGATNTPPPATATNTPPPATATNTPPPATATNTPPPATATNTPPPATATNTPPPATGGGGSGATVSLQANVNNAGIGSDNNATGANFDGQGYSYSAQALQAAGFVPGQTATVDGVPFRWPASSPGSPDNVVARGQTIVLATPATGTALAFLGAASNGMATGTGTVTYTDGSTQGYTLGLSDWTLNGGSASPLLSDSVAAAMGYRDNRGRPESIGTDLFYASVPLQSGKAVASVTLPNGSGGALHLFALSVASSMSASSATATNTPPSATATNTPPPATATNTPPPATATNTPPPATATNTPPPATATNTPPPATATNTPAPPTGGGGSGATVSLQANVNNAGIGSDSNATGANFDGQGYSYSAQALQAAGFVPGQTATVDGVPFRWPASSPGSPDNVVARGQTIVLATPATGTALAFLGAASNGMATGTGTVTYTDGSTQGYTLGLSDWTLNGGSASPLLSDSVAAAMGYRDNRGRPESIGTDLFYASVPLQSGKAVASVTLPNGSGGALHLFALSVH